MGVDTKAFIKCNYKDLLYFIKDKFDSKAAVETYKYDDGTFMYIINFKFIYEERSLHVHTMQFGGIYVKKDENLYFKKYGVRNESSSYLYNKLGIPDNTDGILCSLGQWGLCIEFMNLLCIKFGGWIDENDSDNIYYEEGAKTNKIREIIDYIFTKYKEQ